jgi:3-hydroxyacyl-CoA dehydrogenase/enoyl-CoA hydratase/3-hydroxybutyryl-CoA epimerase
VVYPDYRTFRTEYDRRGVFTVVFEAPGRPDNVFSETLITELDDLVGLLQGDCDLHLVVLTGGRDGGFLTGPDMRRIRSLEMPEEALWMVTIGQRLFQRIESLTVPTVAVIRGPCLGGGLQLALACRYRLALDDRRTRLGLPDVQLGLLPGLGGTQRLPNTVGLTAALEMILTGREVSAAEAAELGLVDLASGPERFDADVRQFISERLKGMRAESRRARFFRRWRDRTRWGQRFALRAANRRIAPRARYYPALPAALDAVRRGVQDSPSAGLDAERKAFADLLFAPQCRNLIHLDFQRRRAGEPSTWIKSEPGEPRPIRRVAVWGAGAMGAGIALASACHGLDVILYDRDDEALHAALQDIRKSIDEAVRHKRLSPAEAAARLGAIVPCLEWIPLDDVDLAVDAVAGREDVPRELFGRWDKRLPPHALITSNTSTLSVARLAEATQRPDRVAGLHFFSPVDGNPLVEVVRTADTSDETLAALLDLVDRLEKTPLVVADRPGFLVDRILFAYLDEAVRMVIEGIPRGQIDEQARRFGMATGPLEQLDEIGLETAADAIRSLTPLWADPSPTPARLAQMIETDRTGTKGGLAFDHRQNDGGEKPAAPDVAQRLIHLLINEAARCLEQGVVAEAWMVDLGVVLGIGFAPFRGGPLRLADDCGISRTVHYLKNLQRTHGDRFAPCKLLVEMSEQGREFHPFASEYAETGA